MGHGVAFPLSTASTGVCGKAINRGYCPALTPLCRAMKPWTRRQPRRKPAPTLSEALDRYLVEVSATKKGRVAEQSIARIWRATRLAIRPVDRIRSSDLTELRDEWLKDRAPATVCLLYTSRCV